MATRVNGQDRANQEPPLTNQREHAEADALSAPFMFNPRKPGVEVGIANQEPRLILHYLRYAPWSAKVEMALRHMGLLGSRVLLRDVDILAWFNPDHSPVAHLWDTGIPRMIPLLEDSEKGKAIADSTPILRYLEKRFPQAPRLFAEPCGADEDFCIAIDSGLALSARRLFVTKLALDHRDVLGWAWGGAFHPRLTRGWRALVHQTVMGTALVRRLGLAQNVEEGLYERVRSQMDAAADALGQRRWLFGEFGAADMALAASIASLTWVPWLRSEPRYSQLFAHQLRVYARLGMKHTQPSVVRGILEQRSYRPALLRRLLAVPYRAALEAYLWFSPPLRAGSGATVYDQVFASQPGDRSRTARNDQRPFGSLDTRDKIELLFDYAFRCQRQLRWMETGHGLGGPLIPCQVSTPSTREHTRGDTSNVASA